METHIFYVNVQSPKQTKKTPNTTNDVVGFSVVYGRCAFSKDSRNSQLVQSCPIVGGITMNAATGDSYFLLPNISQIRCTWTFSTWKPVWGSSLTWDISVSSKSGTITVKENRPGNRSLVECSSQSGESEPLHEVCLCRTRAAAACPGPAGRRLGPGGRIAARGQGGGGRQRYPSHLQELWGDRGLWSVCQLKWVLLMWSFSSEQQSASKRYFHCKVIMSTRPLPKHKITVWLGWGLFCGVWVWGFFECKKIW